VWMEIVELEGREKWKGEGGMRALLLRKEKGGGKDRRKKGGKGRGIDLLDQC